MRYPELRDAVQAQYFADFMTMGEQRVRDQRQKAALLEIDADFDNIRAAWNH